MNKTLWIINEYAGSPYHGVGFRHYYLSKELVKRGYNVYIITASLPVIASNFPLWKEIIEKNDCGICVDPKKPEEIAKAIGYLITHPDEAKKMGENGRKAVLEKYNWEKESEKLLEVYKKCVEY